MFVLDRLDATRLCGRMSTVDAADWARPIPVAAPASSVAPSVAAPTDYSWRTLARNPNALVLTGMIGTVIIKDAMVRMLAVR